MSKDGVDIIALVDLARELRSRTSLDPDSDNRVAERILGALTYAPKPNSGDITLTPPDTQERISEGSKKSAYLYWDCLFGRCDHCPAMVEDKTPRDNYEVSSCVAAQTLDLLRRQRELDARKMRGE